LVAGTASTAQLTIVSAASYQPGISPGSLATAFGTNMSSQTAQATLDQNGALPTSLGGVSLQVGGESAELLYVSPTQINFVVPDDTPVGNNSVQINSLAGNASTTVSVQNVAPGIFFSGTIDKRGAILNAVTFQPDPFTVTTPPGSGTQTYLAIFGTGVRYAGNPSHDSSDQNVAASVTAFAGDASGNEWPLTVQYAGPAPGYAGLDQINVALPSTLDGIGLISVWLVTESQPSNAVELTVRYQAPTTVTSLGQTTGPPGSTITIAGAGFGVGNGSTGLPRTTVLFNLTNGEQLLSPSLGGDNLSVQATVPLILGTNLQPFQGPVQVCVSSDGQQSCAGQSFALQPPVPAPGQLGDTLLQTAQQVLQSSVAALNVLDPTAAAALQVSGNTNIQNLQSIVEQLRAGEVVTVSYADLNGEPATTSLDVSSLQLIESMLAMTAPASASSALRAAGAAARETQGGCAPLPAEAALADAYEQFEIIEQAKQTTERAALVDVAAVTIAGCLGGPGGCAAALGPALAAFEELSTAILVPFEIDLMRYEAGSNFLINLQTPAAVQMAEGEVSNTNIYANFGPIVGGSSASFLLDDLTGELSEVITSSALVKQLANAIVTGITNVVSIPTLASVGTEQVELGGASLTATNTDAASIQLACGAPGSTVQGLSPTAPSYTTIVLAVTPEKLLTANKAGPSLQAQLQVTVDAKIASIVIAPSAPSVAVGQTITLSATAFDANQNPVPLNPAGLVWTSYSSNATVGENTGIVTGVFAGTDQITVTDTKSGIPASVTVTVTPPAIATITISPSSPSVGVGQTITLGVNAFDVNGNPIQIPASAQFQWTSSDTGVATVTGIAVAGQALGNVTGQAAGTALITVTEITSTKSASVTVSVGNPITSVLIAAATTSLAVGQTVNLTATALGANGGIIPSPPAHFSWSSSAPNVATVSAAGAVLGVAAGSATVTVTETTSMKSASVTITVGNPVTSVSITPKTASLTVGQAVNLIATALGANGATIPSPPAHFTWSSSAPAVATVSAAGAVLGVAAGNAIITVTETTSGKQATASVTVTGEDLANTTWVGYAVWNYFPYPISTVQITLVFGPLQDGAISATLYSGCAGLGCLYEVFPSATVNGSDVVLSCPCWEPTAGGGLVYDPTSDDVMNLTVSGTNMSGTWDIYTVQLTKQ
jgi:uncharacterized protein (TIGR03437 family)